MDDRFFIFKYKKANFCQQDFGITKFSFTISELLEGTDKPVSASSPLMIGVPHSLPADVLMGSSLVPAPLTSADLSEKKTYTNHSRLPDLESALWTLRNFALDLAPEN